LGPLTFDEFLLSVSDQTGREILNRQGKENAHPVGMLINGINSNGFTTAAVYPK
jgi:hypothetical protein